MDNRKHSKTIVERFGRFKTDSSHHFNPPAMTPTKMVVSRLSVWANLTRLRSRLRDVVYEEITPAEARRIAQSILGTQSDPTIDWQTVSDFMQWQHEAAY